MPSEISTHLPPGPRGHFLLGNLIALAGDTHGHLARSIRDYGNVVRFRMLPFRKETILVNDPRLIKQVFVDQADAFRKGAKQRRAGSVLGKGLLLAEGEAWKRQRRMLQPAFQHANLERYAPIVRSCAEAMLESWRQGGEREVTSDMQRLTLRVAAQTMFGATLGSQVDRIVATFEQGYAASESTSRRGFPFSMLVSLTNAVSLKRAARVLESVVFEFIAERRRTGEAKGDLLSLLLAARDEDGSRLSDQLIRDEAITALFAGSETTALALAWTFYLLAQHPQVADQVRQEVLDVVGEAEVRSDHLPSLKLLERVLKESLRLYPPLSRIYREAIRDVALADFTIRRGAQVVVSPYLVHRDPSYFPEPERFLPDRWTEQFAQGLPRFAYFPFGGGQRICIGAGFAMMELAMVVATVLPRIRLCLTDRPAVPNRASILRATGGIHLRITPL